MFIKKTGLLLATLVLSLGLMAQEPAGKITGDIVAESSSQPLIEAVITISSPMLKGKKFAVTDSLGKYQFANLPAGPYTLIFEMEGYKKLTKENMIVQPGGTLTVAAQLVKQTVLFTKQD